MSAPPIELSPQVRSNVWKCWSFCLPSAWQGKESSVPAPRPFGDGSLAAGAQHHKHLSFIVEETESKLRLEMESDGSFRKQSVGSSITSSSRSSDGGSPPTAGVLLASRNAKDQSSLQDLLLTETTEEEEEDDEVDGLKGEGRGSRSRPRQSAVARRGPAGGGGGDAPGAILELAWRVVLSLLLLGWLRPKQHSRDDADAADAGDGCAFLTPPPSPSSFRPGGGGSSKEEGGGLT